MPISLSDDESEPGGKPGDARDEPSSARVPPLQQQLEQAYLAQITIQNVLRAQVEGALETSNTLASTVISEAHAAHIVSNDLVGSMQQASKAATQVLGRVSEAIDAADVLERDVLEERTRALEAASASSREMVREQRRLTSVGEKAQDLGMRIRIVAMNTNIEAMRGQGQAAHNSTIGVLAREIGALAVDVQKLGLELSDSVQTLSTHLNRDVVEGMAAEAGAIEQVRQKLAQQVAALRSSHDELREFRDSALQQVAESARKVSTHVLNTLGGIQNQDILRQRLEQVVSVLAQMGARDAALRNALLGVAPLPPGWTPLHPDELSAGYVMASQRAVHTKEADQPEASGGDGPAIELF